MSTRGGWAIDANLFRAADDQLYLTLSCAESEIGAAPQSICLARMADPTHVVSATVRISTPDRSWETRTAAIQEGPAGYTRNGATYLTYSGSANWTTNDYAVGLLANTSDDLLDPAAWVKYGPFSTITPARSVPAASSSSPRPTVP
jgi:GH43 family beta-xylosidase